MSTYQNSDTMESEEAPLLIGASSDESSVSKSSGKLIILAASFAAVLLTSAAVLKGNELQTAFTSLWTGKTNLNDVDGRGNTIYLDRHNVACKPTEALQGYKLSTAPGYKIQENFDCTPVTLGDKANLVFDSTPWNDDGGGNSIFLDRHDVKCTGAFALNSFRYVLHPDYFKGDRRTHYEYQCVDTGGSTSVTERVTTWQGGGGGNMIFLDRANIACQSDELMQGFRYQRNPNNGDEYRYVLKCKKPRNLVPQVSKLPVCLFLHGAMVKGARPTVFKSHHGEIMGSGRTYWGAFNDWYADVCSEFVYGWARTTDKAFDDPELMNSYSDKALEVMSRGGIVIAHSMANAILAAACWKLNKCAQWYSLGGGYSGQAVGPAVLDLMSATKKMVTIPGIGVGGSDLEVGLEVIGAFVSPTVFDGFRYDKNGMRLDKNKATRNAMAMNTDKMKLLKGSVCGVSPKGNGVELDKYQTFDNVLSRAFQVERWKDQAFLGAFMDFVANLVRTKLYQTSPPHADDRSDGLVELAACAFWSDDVSDTSKYNWYGIGKPWPEYGPFDDHKPEDTHILARINHVEECGIFPETGSAIALKWIRNMMCKEIKETQGNKCSDAPQNYNWPNPSKQLGEICVGDWDCNGWNFDVLGRTATTGCCGWELHSMCSKKLQDYAGFYYCPADCVGNPWANSQSSLSGTCEQTDTKLHWPRTRGEPCVVHTDCESYSLSGPGLACCDRQCKDKKRDWAGGYFCPGECKGKFYLGAGTC